EQAGARRLSRGLEVGLEDLHEGERDLGAEEAARAVDGLLPVLLGDPHERAHQNTRRLNHSATVAAITAGGTVSRPSRTNARRIGSPPWPRMTRSHNSVASDPV